MTSYYLKYQDAYKSSLSWRDITVQYSGFTLTSAKTNSYPLRSSETTQLKDTHWRNLTQTNLIFNLTVPSLQLSPIQQTLLIIGLFSQPLVHTAQRTILSTTCPHRPKDHFLNHLSTPSKGPLSQSLVHTAQRTIFSTTCPHRTKAHFFNHLSTPHKGPFSQPLVHTAQRTTLSTTCPHRP